MCSLLKQHQLLLLLLLALASCHLLSSVQALSTGGPLAKKQSEPAAMSSTAGSGGSGSYGNEKFPSPGQQYQQQQMNRFLPEGISQADKLQAFLECRKECIAKCDRLVYVYSTKKEFCHDCLRQCMLAILQQARSLGIDFNTRPAERMLGDSPPPPPAQPHPPAAVATATTGAADDARLDKRERRRRRKLRRQEQQKLRGKNKKKNGRRNRRHRRQKKEKMEQQKLLLKNCIVQ